MPDLFCRKCVIGQSLDIVPLLIESRHNHLSTKEHFYFERCFSCVPKITYFIIIHTTIIEIIKRFITLTISSFWVYKNSMSKTLKSRNLYTNYLYCVVYFNLLVVCSTPVVTITYAGWMEIFLNALPTVFSFTSSTVSLQLICLLQTLQFHIWIPGRVAFWNCVTCCLLLFIMNGAYVVSLYSY